MSSGCHGSLHAMTITWEVLHLAWFHYKPCYYTTSSCWNAIVCSLTLLYNIISNLLVKAIEDLRNDCSDDSNIDTGKVPFSHKA